MSYLQHGHVEKAFYERSDKSYLEQDSNKSFLAANKSSFLTAATDSFLVSAVNGFLEPSNGNRSFLDVSNASYLSLNPAADTSYVVAIDKSYLQPSAVSYLASELKPVQAQNAFLEEDTEQHVEVDTAQHIEEDVTHHLEESGGETSDDDGEDFSHTVDWSLIVPPYWQKHGTQYKCSLTGRVLQRRPVIPERFDIFDLDIEGLIEVVSRFHVPKNNSNDVDGATKYAQLMRQKQDLHQTELQPSALEALRNWKHKKEQQLLGQVGIQSADYSNQQRQMMGVGDVSRDGAADRKKARELLKAQQEQQRKSEAQQKAAQRAQHSAAQQQQLVANKRIAQQRLQQQQQRVRQDQSAAQQEQWQREQQRRAEQARQNEFVKIGAQAESSQRANARQQQMLSGLEDKASGQHQARSAQKQQHSQFLNAKQASQQAQRANVQQQRSHRVQQQSAAQQARQQSLAQQRAQADADAQRQAQERLRKEREKSLTTQIYNLLDTTTCGIDYDDFASEFYRKYNRTWDPQPVFQTDDLDTIFNRDQTLRNAVTVIRAGMTKRVIARRHYSKIAIVSEETNDILTALAISSNVDEAIQYLRQMLGERERERLDRQQEVQRQRQQQQQQQRQSQLRSSRRSGATPFGGAASNNYGLPQGWRVKKTAQGRLFFINDSTKATQWDDPRPLPSGWRALKTAAGRPFYINDINKSTSWNDPRPKINI
eukprot:CAMPEP_0202691878 /NCGR_PEP_ID=MMETSP1385-20130828/6449_1 /ASSEMBLY_ACC=CAM_ASM_000861 /TAXON_ID=933848 /ORGANISM="Elphidium margaritaceum" /LENGTH=710 /DNA_ID=CAMNT_0049347337 /DNA_START=19 /DNA_END=2151 /DNA_ORIENTATION=-